MQPSYIKTKLFIPILRNELVTRARLMAKLSRGFSSRNPLLLVCAPAGYGKTTLVRSWIETQKAATAWYSLEPGDNHPRQFLIYLTNAIRFALPECSSALLTILESPAQHPTPLILTLLINEITAPGKPLILVLDDFHNIETPETLEIISFFIDHLPENASLVLTSRVEPELPIARLRARNALTEIRMDDLRFTLEETAEFFIKNCGISIPVDLLENLDQKTEGWVVGLQLAAMRLNDDSNLQRFVRNLNGNTRFILDYLMDEVLEKQPPEIEDFLYRTAILDQVNPSLSAALLNMAPGEARRILTDLERKNLFIIPQDSHHHWFRYHPLFADLLRSRLEQTHPNLIPELHHRASVWFADRGLIDRSIEHALSAGDPALAASLIEESAENLLLAGKYDTYLRFLCRLSPQHLANSPKIAVYRATAMLFSEYPREEITQVLSQAEEMPGARTLEGEITALQAILKSYSDGPEIGIELSRRALAKIDRDNIFFRNIVERNLGVAYTLKNDLRNANTWFENLLLSSTRLEDWGGVLAAYNYLTYIRKVQGRLNDAGVIYKKALSFIEEKGLSLLPHSIKITAGYGQLLLRWHRIEEAKTYFKRAIALAKKSDILYAFTAYHSLSQALAMENDFRSALAVIQELRHFSQGKNDLYSQIHQQHTEAVEAKIHLDSGHLELAYAWVLSRKLNEPDGDHPRLRFGFEFGFVAPISAQILIAKGFYDQAIRLIESVIPSFIHQGAHAFLIRSLNALAIAHYEKGDSVKALNALAKSIAFAEPENNLGDFLFFGRQISELLYQAMASGLAPDFIGKLLSLSIDQQPGRPHPGDSQAIDPLSKRELDVLALIAEGMTNQEIAKKLYLSKNTIKSHSIKIYRKLNVNNRNQAVSRARLLGILPQKVTLSQSRYAR
jgi:LuxR family maltose regulon positive regulatory protein